MHGVTKAAKQANGNSHMCEHCEYKMLGLNMAVCRVCRDAFIEGFKKGSKWNEKQINKKWHEKDYVLR